MSLSHSGTPHEHDSAIHHAASPVEHIDTLSDSSHGIPVHGRGPAGVTTLVFECTTSPIPGLHELADNDVYDIAAAEQTSTAKISHEEFHILIKYSLPVFGYVLPLTFPPFRLFCIFFSSTQLAEYSFILASVISIGHVSTLALAAATLGSMTASVTGYSIVKGFVSSLDTLLPPAWTSARPYMVGLWTQRMGLFFLLHSPCPVMLTRRLR